MSTAISFHETLLSPAEAAEVLAVKVQTLAVWRCSGRHALPYVKVGASVRYRQSDLETWLRGRTITHSGQLSSAGI